MSMQVFDDDIDLVTTPSRTHHNRRFLDVIGVQELDHVFFRKATLLEVRSVASALSSHVQPLQSFGNPIWLFAFNAGPGAGESISIDVTNGLSVFSESPGVARHQYFERRGEVFEEVPSLTMPITRLPDIDDIRMLHFASFPFGRLPATSTIIEFKAEEWQNEGILGQGHSMLRLALLNDTGRIAGAPTIGLYGDALYLALLGGGAGGASNCGNAETCPPGGQGACEPVPPSQSAGYRCVTGNGGPHGDGLVGVFNQAIQQQLVTVEDADFRLVRILITQFLPKHAQGIRFISTYYALSMVLRFDQDALAEYFRALPVIRRGMSELVQGQDDSTVVDEELLAALLGIVSLHEDDRDPEVQQILRRVRSGLELAAGKTRSEVIELLDRASY